MGVNKEHVESCIDDIPIESCIDISIESKAFGNDESNLKFNHNANHNQPSKVSYKSIANPYQSRPSYSKVLPKKYKYCDEDSKRRYDQCNMVKRDARLEAMIIKWSLIMAFPYYAFFVGLPIYSEYNKRCQNPSPLYSIKVSGDYQLPLMTKEYGIEFYVTSSHEFDEKYPVGTQERIDIENRIIKDYLEMAWDYCDFEQHYNFRRPDIPTPVCDKLESLGIARNFLNAPTHSHR